MKYLYARFVIAETSPKTQAVAFASLGEKLAQIKTRIVAFDTFVDECGRPLAEPSVVPGAEE